jgi:peptidoglycan lytic transglycosylase G
VVEQRPPVTPRRIARRRLIASIVALLLVGAVALGVVVGVRSRGSAAPPPPPVLPPPPKPLRIVFPEGFTRQDMAERVTAVDEIALRKRGVRPKLSASGYLKTTSGKTRVAGFGRTRRAFEGFLFPATYDFFEDTTSKQLVRDQLDTFAEKWGGVNLRYASKKNLTPYDVLIIASMVEKEAQARTERPLVAAVIYNRLHLRMPLGIDATIRYGLNVPPTQSLRESQLHNPTPYNTRLHRGLPPTPIANPGLASIEAAAHPAKVDYVYFVRKPDKIHHFFTASSAAFENYKSTHGY